MHTPRATLVFDNFPSGWIVGVDLQFFNTNSVLRGVKLINEGVHVVHWAADASSVRSGWFFHAVEGEVTVLYWDPAEERMLIGVEVGELNISRQLQSLSEQYSYMVPYPGDKSAWLALTRHLQWPQLLHILPNHRIDSVMTSSDENNLLLKTLQQHSKDRNISNDPIVNSIIDQSDVELKFTLIDLDKTVRPNSTPEEKTLDGLDKSWFVNQLLIAGYNNSDSSLLCEFELAFISMVIFSNYSCSVQWLKLIKVMLDCKQLVSERTLLFEEFIRVMCTMFTHFPDEYVGEFIDDDFLEKYVGEFEYTVKGLGLHKLVKSVVELKTILMRFDIHVHGIPEDDDDAPVVVDI